MAKEPATQPATQPKSPTAGILKFPLAPDTLTRMDKLSAFPSEPFDPNSAVSHFYRYDVCGGRLVPKYNPAMGWLHLSRSGPADAVTLTVEDHLQFEGSQQHRKATIRYGRDGIARPIRWDYEVRYLNQFGKERPKLTLRQQAAVSDLSARVTINGKAATRQLPADFTCSWGLFDAVQRLPRDHSAVQTFSLLDNLQSIKGNHRITYAGKSMQPWGDKHVELHQFRQFGAGTGPTEYWLSEQGELVLVTALGLACIYDPSAVQHAEQAAPLVVGME